MPDSCRLNMRLRMGLTYGLSAGKSYADCTRGIGISAVFLTGSRNLQKTIYQSDGNAILLEDRLESKENEQEKLVNRLALKKVMCELPDQEQKIIIMRYYSGQTQVQTAKCLGISQVQVSRIEKRVLKKMRALLEM